jgi:NodT family efflux transporter outer membrane factor (OMF) lipoprotein
VDVSRAETQLYSAQGELQDLRARRALIEHAIAALIGVPAPAFALASSLAPIKPLELAASMPSVLLQRRPDIAAAERQVAAANATIGVARAAFFPNVQFNAIGGYQSANINLVSAPNSFWSLGPSLSLPIFEGGFLRAQEAATIAGFNLATANYRNTVVTAFKEVADALSQLHWYGGELHADRQAVDAAQHTLNEAMALFEDGAVNYLEVVVAQEQLLGVQQRLLELRTQYLQSGVRLIRALGGGWSQRDLPQPDAMPLRHVSITQ